MQNDNPPNHPIVIFLNFTQSTTNGPLTTSIIAVTKHAT